ncbi:MAG: hypothetical protein MR502_08265 [Bacteroides sp.]|nr:hypothetical protein [Bacteroides sp.]
MKKTILAAFCLMGAIACSNELEYQNDSRTVLTLELPGTTKTVLGDAQDGVRPVLWCKGDKISVNGVVSDPLDVEGNVLKADFVLSGQVSAPYEIIYPAGMVKDAATVTLPAGQKYAEGDNIVSGSMPMAGYSTTESVMMKQVCGILGISLKMGTEANLIRYIEVTALGGEPVCGDFSVDFQNSTLSSEAKDADVIRMEVQKTFPAGSANTFNVILPAGVYSDGFQVKVVDENGRAMVRSIKGSRELGAGKLMLMPELEFVPNSEDKGVEIATPEDWNSFATAYNAGKYPDSQIATITADLDFSLVDADKFVTLGLRDGAKQSPDGKAKYFAGTLNGNGKRILNLKTDVPFIQAIGTGALVKDINIDKTCSFTPWYGDKKQLEFGSLIGYCSDGTVKDCTSEATVTVSQCNAVANKVPLYIGGLIGRNRAAAISNCTSSATIVSNATYVTDAKAATDLYIGGFTGYCSNPNGVLENCSNTGNISVASTARNIYVGGICAKASAGTITGCANSGAITVSTGRTSGDPCKFIYLGGLFSVVDASGDEQYLKLIECSNSGDITSNSNVKQLIAGGIAAQLSTNKAEFTNITNAGNITTTAALRNLFCGGLFGCISATQTLNLSGEPFTGTINIGTTESNNHTKLYCGGLIGQTTENITIGGDVACKSNITYDISTAENIAAESFFGGIIGCAYGAPITISGMKTSGVITIKSPSDKAMQHKLSGFGGIIGGATKGAKISDCSSSVYVKMTAQTSRTNGCAVHFGGIAGRLYGGNVEIKHCTNSGRQQNNHYNNNIWSNNFSGNVTGGIVGSIGYSAGNTEYSAIIDDCHNTGSVYAYRGAAGGIAGYLSNATITNCSSTEDITRSAPGGGIAGVVSNCKVSSCYVKSNITSADGGSACADAGGIIGEAVSSSVDGCRYYGTIIENSQTITGNRVFGGIIGKADDASSAGVTTACGFGGTINGTTITEKTDLSTCAIGSTTGTRGTFYLWNGVLQ